MNHRYYFYILIIVILNLKINEAHRICFEKCKCDFGMIEVDCSGQGLTEFPDIPLDIPIERINFENNNFLEFPYHLSSIQSLTYLNLNGNKIGHLSENALNGFKSLRVLLMENNSFLSWKDLNPNTAFNVAPNLETLSLAQNNITSFSNPNESFLLVSSSLLVLDLSRCKIMKISGDYILTGMETLERLILSGNPLRAFEPIKSNSLKILDLSDCNLVTIHTNSLEHLEKLISLDLSKNPGINIVSMKGDYLRSDTLRYLDLSFCNLDIMNLIGFPNLHILQFAGNMLKKLQPDDFEHNPLLTVLNFSKNSINFIEKTTFELLEYLKHLDLSFNELSRIEPTTFKNNQNLYTLNLSRNPFSRFSKIFSSSITILNLSWCEILKIDTNAMSDLLNITILDLSNNLISDFPSKLRSATLQDLNLAMCRISSINNSSFAYFPELTKLHLSGNRLTSSLKESYFRNNLYLVELWLGDNPWNCECPNSDFRKFYDFVIEARKIQDLRHLRCASPPEYYGKTWENVCYPIWYPNKGMASAERVWTIIMIVIVIAVASTCLFSGVRKIIKRQRRLNNERELHENIEEQRVLRRQNDLMLQERAQQNAPDPRETRPPCYEEAILLPKLERNFKSMDELNTRRTVRKFLRSKTNADLQTDELVLDHYKYAASSERIAERDLERTDDCRSEWKNKMWRSQSGSRLYSNNDSRFPPAHVKSQNLQSAEQIAHIQNLKSSPYSQKKWKMHGTDSISFISISDDELGVHRNSVKDCFESTQCSDKNKKTNKNNLSPYTRRRPRGLSASQLSISREVLDDKPDDINKITKADSMLFVTDHFKSNSPSLAQKKSANSSTSSCFEIMDTSKETFNSISNLNKTSSSKDTLNSTNDTTKLEDNNLVIVHSPSKKDDMK